MAPRKGSKRQQTLEETATSAQEDITQTKGGASKRRKAAATSADAPAADAPANATTNKRVRPKSKAEAPAGAAETYSDEEQPAEEITEAAETNKGTAEQPAGRGAKKAKADEEAAKPGEAEVKATKKVKASRATAAPKGRGGKKAQDEEEVKEPAGAEKEIIGKADGKAEGKAEGKATGRGKQSTEGKAEGSTRGKPAAAASGDKASVLPENAVEQGRVIFLYMPRVGMSDVAKLDDVQRSYLVLQPQQPPGGKCRLIVVPKKKLPDPRKHERFFAFVEAVADNPKELMEGMTEQHYTTKTQGERTQGAARAAGEGTYVIAKGGSRGGTHFAYKLDLPQQPGEAQKVLGIKEEGSLVISAKNPSQKGRPGIPSAGPEPQYTDEQKEQFGSRSWIGVEDKSLLDVAGTELLLIGAKDDPVGTGELGAAGDLMQQVSDEEKEEGQQQQEQGLKEALEPSQQQDAIPIGPAVTGQLE
eukprot:GHRR01002892.1.p1 GENE.GHRR01002892.1~~GHRR01002892.1.p1  ORF type:complete len:474 (+),score=214.49 GHRR01002892.1:199-1620(+)